MVNDGDWQEVTRDGTSVRVRPSDWGQAQAHLQRDGTFVFLVSDNLTGDQLATIAASLRPTPSTGSSSAAARSFGRARGATGPSST